MAKKLSLQDKFKSFSDEMNRVLIGREEEVQMVLTALLCKQHPLLVGLPGIAKSMLLDGLCTWMNVPKFEYLLTKFTDPMELFGPVDIVALKNRKTQRVTEGMMPHATLVFLDELFKASSAILNTTLKILNERTFTFGLQKIKCPLRICLAASNEYPHDGEGGKELSALFDRFLLRKTVLPLQTRPEREALLERVTCGESESDDFEFGESITAKELDQASDEADKLVYTEESKEALIAVWEGLNAEGITPGDRRVKKAAEAVKAFAYLQGAEEVEPDHFEILQHCLWNSPNDAKACSTIITKIAKPVGLEIGSKLTQMSSILREGKDPYEKVKKLTELRDDLKNMKKNPRQKRALNLINRSIKKLHESVVGISDGEEGDDDED